MKERNFGNASRSASFGMLRKFLRMNPRIFPVTVGVEKATLNKQLSTTQGGSKEHWLFMDRVLPTMLMAHIHIHNNNDARVNKKHALGHKVRPHKAGGGNRDDLRPPCLEQHQR
jgi:hypothetical protein